MSQSLMDMMVERALENLSEALTSPDPYVRIQASIAVLESAAGQMDEMAEQFNMAEQLNELDSLLPRDRDDMAEVDEEQQPAQTEEEVLERLAAAEQATGERIPPAAERAGRSPLGSGEQRR